MAEAEAVENNSEIAREYDISESMVRRWRKDQANLFNGELKMSAKRKTMGCYTPKYPELDQTHAWKFLLQSGPTFFRDRAKTGS